MSNVLLITLDQFRADCLSAAGHPLVRTPNLDALAANGVRFTHHFNQCAPCGPSRTSIHTGQYLMNHRAVANGTPVDDRFTNVAREMRRAGYAPALFGYTDMAVDPRIVTRADDPRLRNWEGVCSGFDVALGLDEALAPWGRWLASLGYAVPAEVGDIYIPDGDRWGPARYAAEHSETTFLTNELLGWIGRQDQPWFAHASYIRPHPPFVAPAPYHAMFDPADVPEPIGVEDPAVHPFVTQMRAIRGVGASSNPDTVRRVRAMYYGMIAEVDDQMGRLFEGLRTTGAWDETLIIVTSDHGEQLGDHGLAGKLGFYDESYRIPCIVRDPRPRSAGGKVVDDFTENVDLMPTILDWIGLEIPSQCDGRSLTPWFGAEAPLDWRQAAHFEFDWRNWPEPNDPGPWPWDRASEQANLAVHRDKHGAYVQFADGSALYFDLDADPLQRVSDLQAPEAFAAAREMLAWRMQHAERTLSGALVTKRGLRGRLPLLAFEV